ncbi:MAG: 50S ribosomal protein L18 [Gemmatimonadales bacterium]
MRLVRRPRTRQARRYRRHVRLRKTVKGRPERPRLVVYRSLRYTYAQLIDDTKGHTLVGLSDRSGEPAKDKGTKVGRAYAVGELLAKKAKALGVTRVVFDRGGHPFHGRVKAVADGARNGGLEF